MLKKIIIFIIFSLCTIQFTFSQTVTIDTALKNAANEISTNVPKGTKIAILNITSDYPNLSDYIINELIANLVNTKIFQIVPRSTVELETASRELSFQMSGIVSDESQKRLGQFLGAGTIITGTVTRDTERSYRLVINAIDLESFTYQSTYRTSISNNTQVQTLTISSGSNITSDFSEKQRISASALNLLFGVGSFAIQKDKVGGSVAAVVEGLGIVSMVAGGICFEAFDSYWTDRLLDSYFAYPVFIGLGVYVGGAIYGIIRAQVYSKPYSQVSHYDFPINLELVSTNNKDIDGIKLSYNIKF